MIAEFLFNLDLIHALKRQILTLTGNKSLLEALSKKFKMYLSFYRKYLLKKAHFRRKQEELVEEFLAEENKLLDKVIQAYMQWIEEQWESVARARAWLNAIYEKGKAFIATMIQSAMKLKDLLGDVLKKVDDMMINHVVGKAIKVKIHHFMNTVLKPAPMKSLADKYGFRLLLKSAGHFIFRKRKAKKRDELSCNISSGNIQFSTNCSTAENLVLMQQLILTCQAEVDNVLQRANQKCFLPLSTWKREQDKESVNVTVCERSKSFRFT